MNFYALNATPINGWDTQYAQASGQMVVAGAASLIKAKLGTATAQLTLSATARGTVRRMASAGGSMVTLGQPDGLVWKLGEAVGAMEMSAAAMGRVTVGAGAIATLVLYAHADGRVARGVTGQATGQMVMDGGAKGRLPGVRWLQSDISLWLHAVANGRLAHTVNHASGVMQLDVRASGRLAVRNQGTARGVMELRMVRETARQYREVFGAASAAMEMQVATRAARITTLPGVLPEASRLRSMQVPAENRCMRVPRTARECEPQEA